MYKKDLKLRIKTRLPYGYPKVASLKNHQHYFISVVLLRLSPCSWPK